MIISNKPQELYPEVKFDNQPIERVKSHKHLGVTLTSDLSWKEHAYNIGKKAYNCLGVIRPLRNKIDRATLETLYKSFIRPVLEYADILWHIPADNRHCLDILERVQQEAARIVTGGTRRCPTKGLYDEIAWETLASRREMHRSQMMWKICVGQAPIYLQDLLPEQIQARTRYSLRNRADLQVPFARLETYSHSFFPSAVRKWNTLPSNIKQADTQGAFKYRYLKQYPRPKPNRLYYSGTRSLNIAHAKLRIGCSLLNSDLHNNLHVIASPNCFCHLGVPETAKHFLLVCPLYQIPRTSLYVKLLDIPNLPTINETMLLYGVKTLSDQTNLTIFKYVHHFIHETNRFNI